MGYRARLLHDAGRFEGSRRSSGSDLQERSRPAWARLLATPGREGKKSTAEQGYLYCGPAGAGHFVKMVHNGIEYGLMQAYGEGFDIMKNANSKDLPEDHRYRFRSCRTSRSSGGAAAWWGRGCSI